MKIINGNTELSNYLRGKIEGCPLTVVNDFLSTIGYENDNPIISLDEIVDERGIVNISYKLSGIYYEKSYSLSFNNAAKEYSISKKIVSTNDMKPLMHGIDCCTTENSNLKYSEEEGYAISSARYETDKVKKDGTKFGIALRSSSVKSKNVYNESGVETYEEDIIDFYPDVEDKASFEHVAGEGRYREKTIVNKTNRKDMLNCVTVSDTYEHNGQKFISENVSYYRLSEERDLASMSSVAFQYSSEEEYRENAEYDKTISKEDTLKLLENTNEEAKEDLLKTYYPEMVSSKHI